MHMVAQNMVRTYGVNQVFRFVEGIWLDRKSRQIQNSYFSSHCPCSKITARLLTFIHKTTNMKDFFRKLGIILYFIGKNSKLFKFS